MKNNIIVLDIGSHSIKVGFAGEKEPSLVVPCIVGTPLDHHDSKSGFGVYSSNKNNDNDNNKENRRSAGDDHDHDHDHDDDRPPPAATLLFGNDAIERRADVYDLSYIFSFKEDGSFVLKKPKQLVEIITMALTKLTTNSISTSSSSNDVSSSSSSSSSSFSGFKLFLVRPANMIESELENVLDVFFHTMKFKAVTMFSEAGLVMKAASSNNQETGLVVEAGEGSIRLSSYVFGHKTGGESLSIPILAGRTLSRRLVLLLVQQGHLHLNPNRDYDLIMVGPTKIDYCYAAPSYDDEKRCAKETTLLLEVTKLLDGTCIEMEKERFESVECIFQPSLIGQETKGLHAIIADLLTTGIDVNCRSAVFGNILLSGGTARIPGFQERLEQDLRSYCVEKGLLTKDRAKLIKVSVAKNNAVFCGASSTAELIRGNRVYWVTQSEYSRDGAKGLLQKCKL